MYSEIPAHIKDRREEEKKEGKLANIKPPIIFQVVMSKLLGFFDSSVSNESACNVGDPSTIPGSGRFDAEKIGYPLQYPWASLVAQVVKNPPAMWET